MRVIKGMDALGYDPNASVENLGSQKSITIGVIVPDIDINVFTFTDFIKGVERASQMYNFNILICAASNNIDKEMKYLELLRTHTVDAMILLHPTIKNDKIIQLNDEGYHVVVVGSVIEHACIPCCITNNLEFSQRVVTHFAEQGHREIAFINGSLSTSESMDRLEGYIQGLKVNRLPFYPELIEHGDYNEEKGYQAFIRLINKTPRPTAIYTANDEMALGVYKACKELGLRIPEDISVMGVDDNRIGRYIEPPLSSVKPPNTELGYLAAEMIMCLVNKKDINNRIVTIESTMLFRKSSMKFV
ncbi:LacI family DNA-binding transcriptional regulator [Paenibacillus sp. YYML68]|uniref:LacI family DNA-binding transcriptional regulator n=1 Tax=Paenibacillus sp. YYML68 TaxID=2909250 RepID=UPI0024925FAF|nr:LacI family DNA-binding transcriptional regulator [Paenibacillus sp. YYML68]